MNEVVKYHNRLNNINFGRFTPTEANIFFSLALKFNQTGKLDIEMSYDELKSLSKYPSNTYHFVQDLEKVYRKYLTMVYRTEDEHHISASIVFRRFHIDRDNEMVTLSVDPDMKDVFLGLSENFTRFELQEFTTLKGSYSKSLYRLLKQYRHTGYMEISISDFRFKLDVPKSYQIGQLYQKVINPSIKELSPYFKGLKVEKEYKKSPSGKGRPAVSGYIFTFKAEERYKDTKVTAEPIQKKKVPYPCPRCGGQLVERTMNGKIALCHADGHLQNATCNAIFNGYDEVKFNNPYLEGDGKNLPEAADDTIEKEENREKVKSILESLGKIFGGK